MNVKESKIEFSKIKVKPGAVHLEFEEIKTIGTSDDQEYIDGTDFIVDKRLTPHPDFLNAMSKLKHHVVLLCEFYDDWDQIPEMFLDKIEVTGISLGGDGDYEGVTIVAQRKLKTGKVLNLVTPFTFFQDIENADNYVHNFDLASCCGEIEEEAKLYLGGKNNAAVQLEMQFD